MKFNIHDRVKCIDLKQITGRVVQIIISLNGTEYKVRFFDGVEPREAWLFEDELELVEK